MSAMHRIQCNSVRKTAGWKLIEDILIVIFGIIIIAISFYIPTLIFNYFKIRAVYRSLLFIAINLAFNGTLGLISICYLPNNNLYNIRKEEIKEAVAGSSACLIAFGVFLNQLYCVSYSIP